MFIGEELALLHTEQAERSREVIEVGRKGAFYRYRQFIRIKMTCSLLTKLGESSIVEVEAPFTSENREIVTNGLQAGDSGINHFNVSEFGYKPSVSMRMPSYMLTK